MQLNLGMRANVVWLLPAICLLAVDLQACFNVDQLYHCARLFSLFAGSLLALGALFGSLSAVFLMDAVGRKASLLAFSVMSLFIGWTLLMAASQASWKMLRLLLGAICLGYLRTWIALT